MRCSFCGGAAHPATGCVYGDRLIACYSCTVEFLRWLRTHINKRPCAKRWRNLSFYECAAKWAQT